jgi:tetratricopeptide (TPR) repeat protein
MNKTEVEADSIIIDPVEGKRLLGLLDGLPLAIAQAGAYLQESGVGVGIYLKFYEQQWKELMESRDESDAPLQDYPNRSVWTTWTISYNAIREKDQNAANLLLLWAFLDNRDLWHGLFVAACRDSTIVARKLSEWIGDIASSEQQFIKAIQLLRNYSLIEDVEDLASYATHPVVHRWTYHFQGEVSREELAQLAVVVVGWAMPNRSSRDYSTMQRRLFLHAEVSSRWVLSGEMERKAISRGPDKVDFDETKEKEITLVAIMLLGDFYADQGKLAEAEKMYERALREREEALGTRHPSTLETVSNLGNIYLNQGNLAEAEKMFKRALRGKEEVLGTKHTSTLDTVNNLGILYLDQGKLVEAEKMLERALRGCEEALGAGHRSTLGTVNNLGILYLDQGKLVEAEKMLERALRGCEEALGAGHRSTLDTVHNLGVLYADQGKLIEAEKMYERALRGYEDAIGLENVGTYRPALDTMWNGGTLYVKQGKLTQAREAYSMALMGFQIILGPSSDEFQSMKAVLESLDLLLGKIRCVTNLLTRALTTRAARAGTNNSGGLPVRVGAPMIAHVAVKKKPRFSAYR